MILVMLFFFDLGSLHARLNNHYKAWELQEKEEEKDEKHIGKLLREKPKMKGVC